MRIAPRVGSSACSLTSPDVTPSLTERDVERAAHDAQQQQQAERDAAYAPVVAAGQQTPDPALDEAAAEGG